LGSFGFARTDHLKNYRSNDAEFIGLEVNVSPLKAKQLAHPQTSAERHQYKSSFSQRKRGKQAELPWESRRPGPFAFRTLSYQLNWIAITDLVAYSMIEEDAHQVPDLRATGSRERQGSKPKFDLSRIDAQ
jgi:hypothetical protein